MTDFGLRSGLVGTAKVKNGGLSLISFVFLSFSETWFEDAGCALAESVGDRDCALVGVAGVIFNSAAAYDFPVGNTGDAFGDLIASLLPTPFTCVDGLGVSLTSGKSSKYL